MPMDDPEVSTCELAGRQTMVQNQNIPFHHHQRKAFVVNSPQRRNMESTLSFLFTAQSNEPEMSIQQHLQTHEAKTSACCLYPQMTGNLLHSFVRIETRCRRKKKRIYEANGADKL